MGLLSQAIQVCPEEESILMTSFVDTLAHLHGREGKEGSEFDFQVLTRLNIHVFLKSTLLL